MKKRKSALYSEKEIEKYFDGDLDNRYHIVENWRISWYESGNWVYVQGADRAKEAKEYLRENFRYVDYMKHSHSVFNHKTIWVFRNAQDAMVFKMMFGSNL